MSDVVLNHASSKSIWFKNFLKIKEKEKIFFYNMIKILILKMLLELDLIN